MRKPADETPKRRVPLGPPLADDPEAAAEVSEKNRPEAEVWANRSPRLGALLAAKPADEDET